MQPKTVAGFGVRKLRPSGYSFSTLYWSFTLFILLFTFIRTHELNAQCQLSCRGKINISIGDSCKALITPDMLLTSGPSDCPGAKFRVDVLNDYMQKTPGSPYVTGDYMHQYVIGMVYDSVSKNSCWSKIYVEDKFGPVIDCRMDTTYCNDTLALGQPYFYDNCDPNPTISMLGELVEPFDCDPKFIKKVTRYWQGRDNLGNLGKICSTMIWLKRIPIDSVDYPKNYVKSLDCSLECSDNFQLDANGNPHPYVTGVPNVNGLSLWPSYLFYCNLSTSYEDMIALDLPCKKKIIRLWKSVEWWCGTAVVRTHPQTIEIIDSRPPVLHCPYDFTVSTAGGYNCEANVWMPVIEVRDSCQDTLYVDMHYPGGVSKNQNGGYIKLKPGVNRVVYVARDGCYNEDSCAVYVTVEDKTPPVAVCQQNTVVTMTRDDFVHVYAFSFDDGSYDDCHLDSFLARRMDLGRACNISDTIFRPFVEFCCEDAGKEVMVQVKVTDTHGNYNLCMVNVEVQDKTPPVINCPHDVRVVCSKHNDTIDLNRFGQADYYDNCVVHMHQFVDSFLNQCGLGHLERAFVVRDNMDRYDTCRQRIELYDEDPFDVNDIIWPRDYHMYSCGADTDPKNLPDTFGYPIILDNECSLIGISYEDHQFNYVQDTALCFKILRKWKVIDWCQCYYDPTSGSSKCPTWTWEQAIKVSNHIPPEIQDDCETVDICITTQDCLKERVTLSHRATDDCTPDDLLNASFKIDLHNDGLFDSAYHKLGHVISFDGYLPLGHHRFLWIWEDQCGNQIVCTQFVNIMNCKAPTAYCLTGISVNMAAVDTNGDGRLEKFVDIWAKDVDRDSYQFCGNPVTLSFSRDTFNRYIRYTCDSLGMHRVGLWVTDQLTGLQDVCYTTITIQDNNLVCGQTNLTASVGGLIQTPFDQNISGATIQLDGPNGPQMKEFNGKFLFDNLFVGEQYKVTPLIDKNYLDGVTTLDIVKIQRHILGLESFNSPWHYIAADVTGDKKVTAGDVAALRKLILGIDSKYKSNLSWSFVDANYKFPVQDDPWYEPFPSDYKIFALPGNMMYIDFKGVKVGDVSQSQWAGLQKTNDRSRGLVELSLNYLEKENRIAVLANQSNALTGCQFTLKFSPTIQELQGLSGGKFEISESNVGWSFYDNGFVTMSWSSAEPVSVLKGDVLFFIELGDQGLFQSIDHFDINSQIITAEAYDAQQNTLDISLRRKDRPEFREEDVFGEPVPNPFTNSTQISVYLQENSEINYTISDLSGRQLTTKKEIYAKGFNTLTIDRASFSGPGVYLLQIEAGGFSKSMKLVLIEN